MQANVIKQLTAQLQIRVKDTVKDLKQSSEFEQINPQRDPKPSKKNEETNQS